VQRVGRLIGRLVRRLIRRLILGLTTLAACASAPPAQVACPCPAPSAPAAPPQPQVEWDAHNGTIRCRSNQIQVPKVLREQVRWTDLEELAILPAASPAGGALVVGLFPAGENDGEPSMIEDAVATFTRLHLWAGAGLQGESDFRLKAESNLEEIRLASDYEIDGRSGKLVYLKMDGCRIAAVDFPIPEKHPPLTRMLDDLRPELPDASWALKEFPTLARQKARAKATSGD
jgi:hypothetical protein